MLRSRETRNQKDCDARLPSDYSLTVRYPAIRPWLSGDPMQFDQLKRREFVTLLGGAAAWPLAARAQQAGKSGGWDLSPTDMKVFMTRCSRACANTGSLAQLRCERQPNSGNGDREMPRQSGLAQLRCERQLPRMFARLPPVIRPYYPHLARALPPLPGAAQRFRLGGSFFISNLPVARRAASQASNTSTISPISQRRLVIRPPSRALSASVYALRWNFDYASRVSAA
jgi:hypothetical protein